MTDPGLSSPTLIALLVVVLLGVLILRHVLGLVSALAARGLVILLVIAVVLESIWIWAIF